MMKLAIVTFVGTSLFCLTANAGNVEIGGSNLSQDVSCNSNDIAIYGAQNTIHIKGECNTISVQGSGHDVTFENAKTLEIMGAGNSVALGSAANLTVSVADNTVDIIINSEDNKAVIDVSGAKNKIKISLESSAQIEINGAQNTVEWMKASNISEPVTSIYGVGHIVQGN